MARRPATQTATPAHRKQLTVSEARRGIDRLRERITILQGFDPSAMTVEEPPELAGMEVDLRGTLERIFGHDTPDYRRFEKACDLQWQAVAFYENYPALKDYQEGVREKIEHSLAILAQAVRFLEEEIADLEIQEGASKPNMATRDLNKIFVVHGHNEGAREAVARFIEKIGFEAVILHEKPNKGRTIITKFREEAAGVGFAVVLMTPDDEGKPKSGTDLKLRARQNVVFELGFFIGALGAEHVAALVQGDIDRPSDFDGVVYIPLDDGSWQTQLARELKPELDSGVRTDGERMDISH